MCVTGSSPVPCTRPLLIAALFEDFNLVSNVEEFSMGDPSRGSPYLSFRRSVRMPFSSGSETLTTSGFSRPELSALVERNQAEATSVLTSAVALAFVAELDFHVFGPCRKRLAKIQKFIAIGPSRRTGHRKRAHAIRVKVGRIEAPAGRDAKD